MHSQSPSLGEACHYDALRIDLVLGYLLVDKSIYAESGFGKACGVFGRLAVQTVDVAPPWGVSESEGEGERWAMTL
jgi:hypothetical protein